MAAPSGSSLDGKRSEDRAKLLACLSLRLAGQGMYVAAATEAAISAAATEAVSHFCRCHSPGSSACPTDHRSAVL